MRLHNMLRKRKNLQRALAKINQAIDLEDDRRHEAEMARLVELLGSTYPF